jgi:hypothetical protein
MPVIRVEAGKTVDTGGRPSGPSCGRRLGMESVDDAVLGDTISRRAVTGDTLKGVSVSLSVIRS